MSSETIDQRALDELITWYNSERSRPNVDPERYVVCAGLAVLERMRLTFPLRVEDYVTEKNQVRTGGGLIRSILARFGETRTYAREGGRTTRGTRPAAERLVSRLNALSELRDLDDQGRGRVADALQKWLVDRVREYFNRRRIEVELDLAKPSPQIISDILGAASERGVSGVVAQHLVGAKLALRYPELEIDNFSATTADQQLGRRGDFLIGDTVFHITVAPMQSHLEKCREDVRNGFRTLLLAPDSKMAAARQMAETLEIGARVGVLSIEAFVGQNIEELGAFCKSSIASGVKALLVIYNERVAAVETDQSLLVEIPTNLFGD